MDITRYNNSIQELHREFLEYQRLSDKKVFGVLKELLKKAKALKDDELIGYVYHSIAFAEHFIGGDYESFIKNTKLAYKHLIRVENTIEMMNVHYLVALDALNKGLFDIAYNFFLNARTIAVENGNKTSAAILDESIAHVFMMVGEYKKARRYLKSALKVIKKDTSHPHYFSNVASCGMNDIESCIQLNLIPEAIEGYDKISSFMIKHPDEFKLVANLNYLILSTRIALRKKDRQGMEKYADAALDLIKSEKQISNYIDALQKLIQDFVDKKEYDLAKKFLNHISWKNLTSDTIEAQRVFMDTKIAFYKATKNEKELIKSYVEQNEIHNKILAKHAEVNVYIEQLVVLINDLAKQQEETANRQKELLYKAKTDALTSLKNRYALNQELDLIFEKAYHAETNFGACVLDVDGLKDYNDKYGHAAGDQLLIDFAKALAVLGEEPNIYVARYGGDEFVLIFDEMENADIKKALKKIYKHTDFGFSAGVSNGVPKDNIKPWDFIREADKELYKIKNAKKASVKTSDISVKTFKPMRKNEIA